MANKIQGTLYTGVTSQLVQRVYQHRNHLIDGFSKKYDCVLLVYYETHESMYAAISREKQLKAGPRRNKITLIESLNPIWEDLYPKIL